MMAQDPDLWQHRPLSTELQQYAAADVSQLLAVADRLFAMLGIVGHEVVKVLSQASCQMKMPVMPGTQVSHSLCVFSNHLLYCSCNHHSINSLSPCQMTHWLYRNVSANWKFLQLAGD